MPTASDGTPRVRSSRSATVRTPTLARRWDVVVPPAPESLRVIMRFPYQMGDIQAGKHCPHTPEAPARMEFVFAVANLGPDGWAELARNDI